MTFSPDAQRVIDARVAQVDQLTAERDRLQFLQNVLIVAGAASVLLVSAAFFPPAYVATVVGAVAFVCACFIGGILVEQQKTGWLRGLAAVSLTALVGFAHGTLGNVVFFVPIVTFALYCALLRWQVARWQADKRWRTDFLRT